MYSLELKANREPYRYLRRKRYVDEVGEIKTIGLQVLVREHLSCCVEVRTQYRSSSCSPIPFLPPLEKGSRGEGTEENASIPILFYFFPVVSPALPAAHYPHPHPHPHPHPYPNPPNPPPPKKEPQSPPTHLFFPSTFFKGLISPMRFLHTQYHTIQILLDPVGQ